MACDELNNNKKKKLILKKTGRRESTYLYRYNRSTVRTRLREGDVTGLTYKRIYQGISVHGSVDVAWKGVGPRKKNGLRWHVRGRFRFVPSACYAVVVTDMGIRTQANVVK